MQNPLQKTSFCMEAGVTCHQLHPIRVQLHTLLSHLECKSTFKQELVGCFKGMPKRVVGLVKLSLQHSVPHSQFSDSHLSLH